MDHLLSLWIFIRKVRRTAQGITVDTRGGSRRHVLRSINVLSEDVSSQLWSYLKTYQCWSLADEGRGNQLFLHA